MSTEPIDSQQIGFWETVRLLLRAARRRSSGRANRQRQLLNNRTGSSTDSLNALSLIGIWVFMALLNCSAGYIINEVIATTQRMTAEQYGKIVVGSGFVDAVWEIKTATTETQKEEAQRRLQIASEFEAEMSTNDPGEREARLKFLQEAARTHPPSDFIGRDFAELGVAGLNQFGPLPAMLATFILLAWFVMLVFHGEGVELDLQRQRHPMWEWLFSHPVKPGAVFFAEMLAPIASNPIYTTAPLFFGVLYGYAYSTEAGFAAALLIGVPVAMAAACLGKALEIGVMLRFPPRTRGGLLGIMSWLGQAGMLSFLIVLYALEAIVAAVAGPLRPVAAVFPSALFSWTIGLRPDGSLSFVHGMLFCWFAAATMIAGGVWFTVWGAQRGLAGHSGAASSPSTKPFFRLRFFQKDPLYRKEVLWFLRDRGALVQAILIPVTIAGFQLFNFRGLIGTVHESWQLFSGIAVIFGTYFLWILGPRSLASEGQALWLAQTWPRGIEGLMKAKARLWFLIATALVTPVLIFPLLRFPSDVWKILLIGIGWILFGRSMSLKSVTLVSAPSSSGEPEPIPKGRRWAAALGMLTFATGILTQQWRLVVVGIVYSWVTAAAMWEAFRARLPYLFDPWSEKVPPPPTLMHSMIAISAFIEGSAVVMGLASVLLAQFDAKVAPIVQSIIYGICALAAWLVVSEMLANRGVPGRKIWRWHSQDGDDDRAKGLPSSLALGVAGGIALAFLAKGYLFVLSKLDAFAPLFRAAEEQSSPNLRIALFIIAVLFAPFAEEYLFRGLLFRALDREWGGWRALLGSAAFFAIYHPPLSWLPVALVGMANAFIFKKTGRLAPAVVLHMVYNAIVLY
jgi:membrane protease YdiL (CAAX protease family)